MSEFNVDIYSSGFVGVGADSPTKKTEQVKLAAEQEEKAQLKAQPQTPAYTQEVSEAVTEVNDFLKNMNRNLSFSVDKDSGDSIIIIKDSENDEVIRQIPSEELLVIRKKMDYLVGVLFDAKV
ncbi:flagellar protein FlaG [Psychromonas algicola]|uniref:flagellar protein FlaG n=1 Tax=Psychromonas algicola TaxID=2555642 RepID=UPI00106879B8|nr:flagellar protein FlaG [Psychromonas sp. RZ5]TEW51616.1 flagellar protein FlaG [Psychromonas sp. RZ5]